MIDEREFRAVALQDQCAVAWNAVVNAGLPEAVRERYPQAVRLVRDSPRLRSVLADGDLRGSEVRGLEAEVRQELRTRMGLGPLAWLLSPLLWRGAATLARLVVEALLRDWWVRNWEPRASSGWGWVPGPNSPGS